MVNLLTGHDVRPEKAAAGLAAFGRFPANRLGAVMGAPDRP